MSSFGSYGHGAWYVRYQDLDAVQVNRFETEQEARQWAKEHPGGRVGHDRGQGHLFELGALQDRAEGGPRS